MTKAPAISANKLAEFMFAKAARQREILRDCKYPTEFKGMYYKEADESIAQALASNLENLSIISNQIAALEQRNSEKLGTQRRINSNIDALESFLTIVDGIELGGADLSLGEHAPQKLVFHGVAVSVRPQIIMKKKGKSGDLVGAIKLHHSRGYPHNEESAGIMSAVMQEWLKATVGTAGIPQGDMCFVIDTGVKKVFKGVKATTARMKDVTAACQNIAGLWPTITP